MINWTTGNYWLTGKRLFEQCVPTGNKYFYGRYEAKQVGVPVLFMSRPCINSATQDDREQKIQYTHEIIASGKS